MNFVLYYRFLIFSCLFPQLNFWKTDKLPHSYHSFDTHLYLFFCNTYMMNFNTTIIVQFPSISFQTIAVSESEIPNPFDINQSQIIAILLKRNLPFGTKKHEIIVFVSNESVFFHDFALLWMSKVRPENIASQQVCHNDSWNNQVNAYEIQFSNNLASLAWWPVIMS